MSLQLVSNFVEQENLVIPLAQSSARNGLAIRVASNGSGTLGTLSASNPQALPVTWTIFDQPAWISLTWDATSLVATLAFFNAQAQPGPYQFFVSATDGVTTEYFPFFLEVRDPLSIAAVGGATNFNVPSYDSTVSDIVFNGIGIGGSPSTGVSFIPPPVLPSGMKFITSDGASIRLRVNEGSVSDTAGGLRLYSGGGVSQQVTLGAYKAGTLYDTPDRCAIVPFMIQSNLARPGVPELAQSVQYDTAQNAFKLESFLDFLGGQAASVTYEWTRSGSAAGTTLSGGTGSSPTLVWAPTSAGLQTFTLNVLDALTGNVLATASTPPIACAVAGPWSATNAIKMELGASEARGYAGSLVPLTISTPASELAVGETVTLSLTIGPASTLGTATESAASLVAETLTLTAAQPSASTQVLLPASSVNQKWVVNVAAANSTSSPTRTGCAQATFVSNGTQAMTVTTASGYALTSNVGQSIAPVPLVAEDAQSHAVTGALFTLSGAPDGLYIGGGMLCGNVVKPGTYTFAIVAEAAGFARTYSAPVTLTASPLLTPLTVTDAVPGVSSVPDNTQFNISWGYAGSAQTLNLAQGINVRSVLGITSTAATEVGASVFTVYGSSFYGTAYSIPALVLSSSVVQSGALPDAPTLGTIDENFNLTLQWNPAQVNDGYLAYRAFDIWLKQLPNGTSQLQTINGALPTGLEPAGSTQASRLFTTVVGSGDWQVSMQALTSSIALAASSAGWDAPHTFPTAITPSSITFDNDSISLGQTLTLSLDPNYTGADLWQAVYPDGTSSGWLPVSVKQTAKTFNTAGTLAIIVQTLRSYATANPPVKLMRQVTLSIVVMNQQYTGSSTGNSLTGNLGVGGEAGFEVTDASTAAVALEPYEVIVRALVRDSWTNELKLMVATSRTANASSLLGTMALDVFPLAGRPRELATVNPAVYLSADMSSEGNPPSILTTTLPTIRLGQPMNDFPLRVSPNTGVAPFSWYSEGLPGGLRLSTNGTLSGTPTQVGAFQVNISCVDSNRPAFITRATLTLVVQNSLAIPAASLPDAVVGVPYNRQLASVGGLPPFTWSIVAGQAPRGVVIDPNTGTLEGTPVAYDSNADFKTYTFTVQVADAVGGLVSRAFSVQLDPAPLQIGPPDQQQVFAGESFNLSLPIFGGQSPYVLSLFTDDGVIGTGVRVASPERLALVAGVEPASFVPSTANQVFFPEVYPFAPSFSMAAVGGVAPYSFSILSGTLPSYSSSGALATGAVTADGTYTLTVECADAIGNTATETVQVTVQLQNGGSFAIKPVTVNMNGSTNPSNWTVAPIAALPDAALNQPYSPGGGVYYGLGLFQGNTPHFSQSPPMGFAIRSGAIPNGMLLSSANGYETGAGDFSGLQLFSLAGQLPTTNGAFSFAAEFLEIATTGGATQAVSRESITVTATGGGTSVAVVVVTTDPASFNLSNIASSGSFFYPLVAEGGAAPYGFHLASGTTLPSASIGTANGVPAIVSNTTRLGAYTAQVTATDANGNQSPAVSISVTIEQSTPQPVHIVSSNLPTSVYANRPLPANTYFVESDLPSAWSAVNLPAGVTLRPGNGTYGYLEGTPTQTGPFTAILTATSLAFNTTASASVAFSVLPQAAAFLAPPYSALVGTAYRVSSNNALVSVRYTGYQPGDQNLPLVVAQHGTVGAPGTFVNGVPTTQVSSLTADGFTMSFDYTGSLAGTDTLTLGTSLATATVAVGYPALSTSGTTASLTVSEYSNSATVAFPVLVSGGLSPYTIVPVAFTDSRFSASGSQIAVDVSSLPVGQTTTCTVQMQVLDSAGNTSIVNGTLQVAVQVETTDRISFSNGSWVVNTGSGSASSSITPNQAQSIPVLGHAPYQYYVDTVALPLALAGFVHLSPSRRVWAIQVNNSNTSATLSDAGPDLSPSGSFVVAATPSASVPTAGTYTIPVTLRLVDANGITTSQGVTVSLVLS